MQDNVVKQNVEEKPEKKPRKPRVKKLTVVNNQAQVPEVIHPEDMIMKALDKEMTAEVLEMLGRLLDLRDRIEKANAEKAFREAMSKFQAECPIIIKSAGVDYITQKGTEVKYQYAPLDQIVAAVKDKLGQCGLSYTFTTEQTEKAVMATCHAYHIAGHMESTSFTIPIDFESYMNAAQKVASALTYSKRYAFCNAFGILTGDVDDDGHRTGNDSKEKNAEQEALKKLNALPANIKKGLEEIGHKLKKDQWQFCNDRDWNKAKILKAINDIKKQKAEAEKRQNSQKNIDLTSARKFWADFTPDMKQFVKDQKWSEMKLAEFCEKYKWDMARIDVEITKLTTIPPELDPEQNQKDLPL